MTSEDEMGNLAKYSSGPMGKVLSSSSDDDDDDDPSIHAMAY